MLQGLLWVGRIAGIVGAAMILVAFGARLTSVWHVGGMQVGSLLLAGVGLCVLATLAYAAHLAERAAPPR